MNRQKLDELSFDADPIYWRMLGSAALTAVDRYSSQPFLEYQDGKLTRAWSASWLEQSGNLVLLDVQAQRLLHPKYKADTLIIEPRDNDNLRLASFFSFDVVPRTNDSEHHLAVMRTIIPSTRKNTDILKIANSIINVYEDNPSLAAANGEDATRLYLTLTDKPFAASHTVGRSYPLQNLAAEVYQHIRLGLANAGQIFKRM